MVFLGLGLGRSVEFGHSGNDNVTAGLVAATGFIATTYLLYEISVQDLNLVAIGATVTDDGDLVSFYQAKAGKTLVVLGTVTQIGSGKAIDIHSAGLVGEVEVAIGGVDAATDGTGEFVFLGRGLSCSVEFGHSCSDNISSLSTGLIATLYVSRRGAAALGCALILGTQGDEGYGVAFLDIQAGERLVVLIYLGSGKAIDINGAGLVGEVKVAIDIALDIGNLTGEFIPLGAGHRCGKELRDRHNLDFACFSTGFTAAFTLGVAVDVAGALTYGLKGGSIRTNILGNRTVNHHYVTHFDVGLAGHPLLVVQIVGLIDIEFSGAVFFVHDVEIGIAISSAGGERSVHLGNLALHVVALLGLGVVFQCCGNGRDTGRIERILQGTIALGFAFTARLAAFALAIEAVDEAAALAHGFRSVALVVDNFTADNHFVAFLNVGVAALPLTVAKIISLEYIEALAAIFIDNVERSIAIGAAGLEGGGHRGDLALEIDILLAGLIGREGTGIFQDTGYGERVLQGTVAIVDLAFRTCLVDGEGGTGEADGEHDGGRTVVLGVLRNSNFNRLGLYCGLAGGCAEGDPFRDTAYSPVTGGRDI